MFCRRLMDKLCFYSTYLLFRSVWTWSWGQLSNCVTTLNESSWLFTSSLPAESLLLPDRLSSCPSLACYATHIVYTHCVYPSPSPKKKTAQSAAQTNWLIAWGSKGLSASNAPPPPPTIYVSHRVKGLLSDCLIFFAFEEWMQTTWWKFRSTVFETPGHFVSCNELDQL